MQVFPEQDLNLINFKKGSVFLIKITLSKSAKVLLYIYIYVYIYVCVYIYVFISIYTHAFNLGIEFYP